MHRLNVSFRFFIRYQSARFKFIISKQVIVPEIADEFSMFEIIRGGWWTSPLLTLNKNGLNCHSPFLTAQYIFSWQKRPSISGDKKYNKNCMKIFTWYYVIKTKEFEWILAEIEGKLWKIFWFDETKQDQELYSYRQCLNLYQILVKICTYVLARLIVLLVDMFRV